jgi:hypothetical protein
MVQECEFAEAGDALGGLMRHHKGVGEYDGEEDEGQC